MIAKKKTTTPFQKVAYAANDNGGNLMSRRVPLIKPFAASSTPKLFKIYRFSRNGEATQPYLAPDTPANDEPGM